MELIHGHERGCAALWGENLFKPGYCDCSQAPPPVSLESDIDFMDWHGPGPKRRGKYLTPREWDDYLAGPRSRWERIRDKLW